MPNPALCSSIQLIATEKGYVAFDPKTDKVHELNPVASLIVELCDGTRTVDEIFAQVAPILPEGSAAVVKTWIEEGVAGGLLVWDGNPGDALRELSSAELHKISRRLRYREKEELALICQRQATELAPDDPDMWYDLGELAEMMGRRDESRAAYEKYFAFKPDDAEIGHILVALRGEPPPPRMSNETLEQIYAEFSRSFESNLVGELGYRAPEVVYELLAPLLGDRRDLAILDLGCGTGLAGVQFKPRASRLIGVDISPEMIALARARNLYDRLDVAEITAWLERPPGQTAERPVEHTIESSAQSSVSVEHTVKSPAQSSVSVEHTVESSAQSSVSVEHTVASPAQSSVSVERTVASPAQSSVSVERFELVLSCDCLIYFGDLRQVVLPVAQKLCPKGLFAFTLERGDSYPHRLADSGRYTHHPDHVREVAAEAGLKVVHLQEGFLRNEYSAPVTGLFVALEKPSRD